MAIMKHPKEPNKNAKNIPIISVEECVEHYRQLLEETREQLKKK